MTTSEEKQKEKEQGQIREQTIQEIVGSSEIKNHYKIPYRGNLEEFPVYQIPLDALIYNKYNGRILSETKSMESLGTKILPHTKDGEEIIEELLWKSKLDANERTMDSLDKLGQEKVAVISKDGVVIDGNRRTMLLNKLPQYGHLETIILPLSSYDDWLEIEHIETQIQMGGDKAIDYDPIQIYLKIQSMYNQMDTNESGSFENEENDDVIFSPKFDKENINKPAIKKIYGDIGNYKTIQSVKDIEFFLMVMDTMDEYLHSLDIPEAYPALDGKEEQCRGLTTSLNHYYGQKSVKPFPNYSDDDVDDYKLLAFDFIRLRQKNEDFRMIAGKKTREDHIIGDKERWKDFFDNHQKIVNRFSEEEFDGNSDPRAIRDILAARDNVFKNEVFKDLNNNFEDAVGKVKNKNQANKPNKLVTEAIDKVEAINIKHAKVKSKEVQKKTKELAKKAISILGEKGQLFILKQAISWLEKVTADKENALDDIDVGNKDEILSSLTAIRTLSYQAEKKVKRVQ